MKERIIEFLRAENKSSAQFAEEIGVQPSGISHVISGRNNPSLDFILKMLDRYKYLSTDWLLFGKGAMYKDNSGMQSLFEQSFREKEPDAGRNAPANSARSESPETQGRDKEISVRSDRSVDRIVMFYNDGSFESYFPH